MKKLIALLLLTVSSVAFAQVKISDLPAAATLDGSELVPVVQSATTVRTTAAAIKALGFGFDAKSTWNSTTANLTIGTVAVPSVIHAADGSGTVGGNLTIRAGLGSSNNGGDFTLKSGDGGGGSGAGGTLSLAGCPGTINGDGGTVNIAGGNAPITGTAPAAGGSVTLTGGNSDQGTPGGVTLNTGTANSGSGGTILLRTKSVTRVTIGGTGTITVDGATTFNSPLTTSDDFSIQSTLFQTNPASPTALSAGNTDNYNPAGLGARSIFRVTPDAAAGSTITGIASMTAGMEITLFNIQTGATGVLTIAHENAGSSATNRIICPGETDLLVLAGDSVTLWRDSSTGRWRVKR